MASDSPQLPVDTITAAFSALHGHDAVFGRVHDGGYYLVGVQGFHDLLAGVPMSTITAADALVAQAARLGIRLHELPSTFDIDLAGDLDWLRSATHDALTALGLW